MSNSRKRIMLVGEDKEDTERIAQTLEKQGYEPLIVSESNHTIKIAESAIPHAFLLDLVMRPPDGFQLCRILRKHSNFKRTPILILTSLDRTDSMIVAIGAGATDFLIKPIRAKDLLSKVKKLFDDWD